MQREYRIISAVRNLSLALCLSFTFVACDDDVDVDDRSAIAASYEALQAEVGGVNYSYVVTANNHCQVVAVDENTSGSISVPSQINNLTVSGLAPYAFKDLKELVSVSLPEGITTISGGAFSGCKALTSVSLPASVTYIDSYAFQNCQSLASIALPSCLDSIGKGAFANCNALATVSIPTVDQWCKIKFADGDANPVKFAGGLTVDGKMQTEITFPQGITAVNDYAFLGDTSIVSVILPQGISSVGVEAFRLCSALKNVSLPSSLTTLSQYAFQDCSSLSTISIPQSVTTINKGAFSGCNALTSVDIASVASWCKIAFADAPANPIHNAHNVTIAGVETTEFVISDVTAINDYAFAGLAASKVTISDGVTKIGVSAFDEATFAEYTLPSTLDSIGDKAFHACVNISSVRIPPSVKSLGEEAFADCSTLGRVVIQTSDGAGLPVISKKAFANATALSSLSLYDCVTKIEEQAFYGCNSLVSIGNLSKNLTTIGDEAFAECSKLSQIELPASIRSIGSGAFNGCSELALVTMQEGTTSIPSSFLKNCSAITTFAVPEGVTSIGDDAFYGCDNLASITLPSSSLESIGKNAFNNCKAVKYIDWPASIRSVGNGAFTETGLKFVNIHDIAAFATTSFGNRASNPLNTGISFLIDSVEVSSVEIPSSVTDISSYAFAGAYNLKSITLNKGLLTIGAHAFDGSSLTSINLPSTIETIEESTFEACRSLVSIGLSHVVTIATNAFKDCSKLADVEIPETVTSIGADAFSGCTALSAVYTTSLADWLNIGFASSTANPVSIAKHLFVNGSEPTDLQIDGNIKNFAFYGVESLTSVSVDADEIGKSAFANCTYLKSFTHSNSLTTIPESAFKGCTRLSTISLDGITTIEKEAFSGCGLTKLQIPSTLTTVASKAFAECTSLGEIRYNAIEDWLAISFADTLANPAAAKGAMLYVGERVRNLTALSITSDIGNFAFAGVSGITSVTLAESVSKIGNAPFCLCADLTTINSEIKNPTKTNLGKTGLTINIPVGTTSAYIANWGEENTYVEK